LQDVLIDGLRTGDKMMARDNKGRFIKGSTGNPKGRPPRATEEEYRGTIRDVIPLERFTHQLEALAKRADRGDSRAFDKICDLLGLHVIKTEHSGRDGEPLQIVVSYVNDPITTPGLASRAGED
jgi:hypothetical protein